MQLPWSIKGLFPSCVQKFLFAEFNNRKKLMSMESSTSNLQPETRQMPHLWPTAARVTMHLCQGAGTMKLYPNASETCQDPPNSVGMTLTTGLLISGLFFTTTKSLNTSFDRRLTVTSGRKERKKMNSQPSRQREQK